MKRMIKIVLGGSLLSTGMIYPSTVFGEEVISQSGDSKISIDLIQSPLHLTTVQAPSFGTYTLSGDNQKIQADGDLVIQVEDTRVTDLHSWGIQYEVSIFETSDGAQSLGESGQIHVGSGKLTMADQAVDEAAYNSRSVELASNKNGTLLQVASSYTSTFSYRVPKENISISIPERTKPGVYTAVQTVTLVDLPTVY